MDNIKQLQKKLDKVFQNGALFTYEIVPGSVTLIASKAWALRQHEDSILIGIVFASNPRRWLHRITDVKEDGSGLLLTTSQGRIVGLRPLNTQFVKPEILERIKSDDRIPEEIDEELDAFLEANPHMSLDAF